MPKNEKKLNKNDNECINTIPSVSSESDVN